VSRRIAVVLLCLLPVACGHSPSTPPAAPPGTGVVVAVVDGDTLEVRIAGRVERVRLLGIDTPETVDPDRPVECHGPEASALTHELLPDGATVRLERDEEARDHFGRLLAYVFRDDGTFVNEALLAAGAAEVLSIRPNDAYAARLAAAADSARAAGAGMWSACPPP
jgi:micrococcal nuclease